MAKNDFNINRSNVSHEEQNKTFDRLLKGRVLQFSDIKDSIDPNNLVYKFSGSENKPIDFGNYQMPLKLFEDLQDGDINPKEIKV